MFVVTDPNDKHFKKIEEIVRTKECIVCNNKLKDTAIYFSDDEFNKTIHPGQNRHKYSRYYCISKYCFRYIICIYLRNQDRDLPPRRVS